MTNIRDDKISMKQGGARKISPPLPNDKAGLGLAYIPFGTLKGEKGAAFTYVAPYFTHKKSHLAEHNTA